MSKFGEGNFDESNNWRVYIKNILEKYEYDYKVKVINPNDYFSFNDVFPKYKTQREIMEFDLNRVRNSNLIIVNFNDVYSLGTMAEIAIAYENRIPIIGLNINKQDLHPWQIEMCNRIFGDIGDMLDYTQNYYLN